MFSNRDFFKTVHLEGELIAQEGPVKDKKEPKPFVVDNPVFKVTLHSNTIHKPHQLDKHKGLLEKDARANNRTL